MADWTDQDPNTLLPGEPWTSAKALAAFENVQAAMEGADGAPRNVLKSLERLVAGDSLRSQSGSITIDTNSTSINSDTESYFFGFMQIGSIRVKVARTGGDNNFVVYTVNRIRNGATTELASVAATDAYSLDVNVIPGDTVEIELFTGSGQWDGNASFSTNGENLWPAPLNVRLVGNDV